MKTIVIVNGSPRLKGNTSQLLNGFSKGLRSQIPNANIVEVNLYQLNYSGCRSCFTCKVKGGKNYGKCVLNDDLKPVLDLISKSDCLVVASPIYLQDISGQTKCFIERLCFSLGSYEKGYRPLSHARIPVITIYTMNSTSEYSPQRALDNTDFFLGHIFSPPKRICAYNTYQFSDYSKYMVEVFSEVEKAAYRDSHFKNDINKTFNLGKEIGKTLSLH